MDRAWPAILLSALAFTGAWFVGRYGGDGSTDFRSPPEVLQVRLSPNVVVGTDPELRITAEELNRALRRRRPPVVVTVKKP